MDEMCVRVPGAIDVALRFPPQLPAQCSQTGLSSPWAPIQQPAREMEVKARAPWMNSVSGGDWTSHTLTISLTPKLLLDVARHQVTGDIYGLVIYWAEMSGQWEFLRPATADRAKSTRQWLTQVTLPLQSEVNLSVKLSIIIYHIK